MFNDRLITSIIEIVGHVLDNKESIRLVNYINVTFKLINNKTKNLT